MERETFDDVPRVRDYDDSVLDGAARFGVRAIDGFARSARTQGPIAFSYAAAICLLVAGFVFRSLDRFDATDFLGVLVLAGVIVVSANTLALFRFRAEASQTANITQSHLDALKDGRDARNDRLAGPAGGEP